MVWTKLIKWRRCSRTCNSAKTCRPSSERPNIHLRSEVLNLESKCWQPAIGQLITSQLVRFQLRWGSVHLTLRCSIRISIRTEILCGSIIMAKLKYRHRSLKRNSSWFAMYSKLLSYASSTRQMNWLSNKSKRNQMCLTNSWSQL